MTVRANRHGMTAINVTSANSERRGARLRAVLASGRPSPDWPHPVETGYPVLRRCGKLTLPHACYRDPGSPASINETEDRIGGNRARKSLMRPSPPTLAKKIAKQVSPNLRPQNAPEIPSEKCALRYGHFSGFKLNSASICFVRYLRRRTAVGIMVAQPPGLLEIAQPVGGSVFLSVRTGRHRLPSR